MNDEGLRRGAENLRAGAGGTEKQNIPEPLLRLLAARGYDTEEKLRGFLYPGVETLHSPFLLRDMDRAAQRVESAVSGGERILIYGDYDADGVTSTALLLRYLKSRGAEPAYYIPDRLTEGYGVNSAALESFAAGGPGLMITVDTGCTAALEIAYAKSLGVDTVVTDHHECLGDLPACCAVVDPMRPDCAYPFRGLAGVGVAFKLICALEMNRNAQLPPGGIFEKLLDDYADLVAIGTVADVMPLTDENRYIVKRGLELLNAGRHAGLSALIAAARKDKSKSEEITAQTIGYVLAPRVNAAGRMGSVQSAIDLFMTDDRLKASGTALTLCELNEARKAEEAKIMRDVAQLLSSGSFDGDAFLVMHGRNWHDGVIGIAASRVLEATGKPVFLLTGAEGVCKGSGRSPEGCDLTALLAQCAPFLIRCGGHEQAAGLTIAEERLEEFRAAANAFARSLPTISAERSVSAEMTLSPLEMTLPFALSLKMLEPCGSGNPVPTFSLGTTGVEDVIALSGGKHTKLILNKDGVCFQGLMFGCSPRSLPVCPGARAEAVFELSVNEYLGKSSLQLMVRSLIPCAEQIAAEREAEETYRALLDGEEDAQESGLLPGREDFALFYRYLMRSAASDGRTLSLIRAAYDCGYERRMPMLLLMLDVFAEAELLKYRRLPGAGVVCDVELLPITQKADLTKTKLMASLTGRRRKDPE